MSTFNTSHLNGIGNPFNASLTVDEHGYLGRECPVETCLGYFKITPGTGLSGDVPCHCPYCGHSGEMNSFHTQEQLEYAQSLLLRQVTDAIHEDLKALEFDYKPKGSFGIGLSLTVTAGDPIPIAHYREKQLETELVCNECTLRYAIYGVFGWCPDCAVHNSFQILNKNLELSQKMLSLAVSLDQDLADHLIADALENIVSAFDGFGREVCLKNGSDIRFQNLAAARKKVLDAFQVDFADGLTVDQWEIAGRMFQKRHLLAHKMGVVDDDYIQKANDPGAIVGRKIKIGPVEVESASVIVKTLGQRLHASLLQATP